MPKHRETFSHWTNMCDKNQFFAQYLIDIKTDAAENHSIFHSFIHFWHAPLGLHSAKRRHQSPEWTILSDINCFIQEEVTGFQVLLDSFHPRSTRAYQWSPPVLRGEAVKIYWHLFHRLAFAQCGRTGRNAMLKQ